MNKVLVAPTVNVVHMIGKLLAAANIIIWSFLTKHLVTILDIFPHVRVFLIKTLVSAGLISYHNPSLKEQPQAFQRGHSHLL